tara:strand:- start:9 stop:266 length:258 start_codon:yes stop_codon:yes gene_type:complete
LGRHWLTAPLRTGINAQIHPADFLSLAAPLRTGIKGERPKPLPDWLSDDEWVVKVFRLRVLVAIAIHFFDAVIHPVSLTVSYLRG